MFSTFSAVHRLLDSARTEQNRSLMLGRTALATTILTGATYNAFAKQLMGALSPLSLLFLSELLTALFVLLLFGALPTLRLIAGLPSRSRLPLLVLALLSSVIAPLLWFTGLSMTSAVHASIFGTSDALFMLILAIVVLREPWGRAHALSGLCIALGISLILFRGFQQSIALAPGDLLILLAAFIFASTSIIYRKYLHHVEPQAIILARSFLAIFTFLVATPFLPDSFADELVQFPGTLVLALLGFTFVSRFLHIFSFYASIDRLPVSTVSLWWSFSVVLGPVFAALYLGQSEPLTWYHIVGAGLVLYGTISLERIGLHPSVKHLGMHLEHRAHHRP